MHFVHYERKGLIKTHNVIMHLRGKDQLLSMLYPAAYCEADFCELFTAP